jgi:uncharacterized membrane protein
VRKAAGPQAQAAESLGFERLVFFSDAVFAIAITLLVIEVRLPAAAVPRGSSDFLAALGETLPLVVSFLVSFVVIGSLWLSHHRFFRIVQKSDGGLMLLNLLFLLFVASLPFPTAIVGRYSRIPEAEALYSAWVAAAGLAKLGMWLHAARGKRLIPAALGPRQVAIETVRFVIPGAVFLVSIPLAWVHWLAPIAAWYLAPLGYFTGKLIAGRKAGSTPVRARRRAAGR